MGRPETIVSDNGPQFASKTFTDWCNAQLIAHLTSAPFHPASKGQAERFVGVFKQAMKRAVREKKKSKHLALRDFLQQYPVTTHCRTGQTPAELKLGHQVRSSLSLSLCATTTCAQSEISAEINIPSQAENHNRCTRPLQRFHKKSAETVCWERNWSCRKVNDHCPRTLCTLPPT